MPARRLSSEPATIHPYDVLAQTQGSSDLMVHALLCIESESREDVSDSTTLKAFHMGPPLGAKRQSCDAAGNANLTADQQKKLKAFVDDRQAEKAAEKKRLKALGRAWEPIAQYRIQPAATRPTRKYPHWRFSCAGLVLQAYQSARIHLLKGPFPLKKVEDLKWLYPYHAAALDDPDTREMLGIGAGDRWPVALVGYVLHSLDRTVDKINGPDAEPYVPKEGDEFFPRRTDSNA